MTQNRNEATLISSSTILILSGVVLGLATDQFLPQEMVPYLIASGLAGILTYLICDLAATRRALEELEKEREQIEGRLDKHTFSICNPEFTLTSDKDEETDEQVTPAEESVPATEQKQAQLVS